MNGQGRRAGLPAAGNPLSRYPPIGHYGFVSDCHSAALVSTEAPIDWLCMPRLDSASVFGRLLDWDRGGGSVSLGEPDRSVSRRYLPKTMVLETLVANGSGTVRVTDFLAVTEGGARRPRRQIVRAI